MADTPFSGRRHDDVLEQHPQLLMNTHMIPKVMKYHHWTALESRHRFEKTRIQEGNQVSLFVTLGVRGAKAKIPLGINGTDILLYPGLPYML